MENTIGYRLNQALEERKVSAYTLSKQINMSQSIISGYKKGKQVPKLATIKLIASVIEVNEEWLLNGTGEMLSKKNDERNFKDDVFLIESLRNQINQKDNEIEVLKRNLNEANNIDRNSKNNLDKIIGLLEDRIEFLEKRVLDLDSIQNLSDKINDIHSLIFKNAFIEIINKAEKEMKLKR